MSLPVSACAVLAAQLQAWDLIHSAAAPRCCCPPRSPCEINDNVSPALLNLSKGQRCHITPDFQSLLDGPSHFGFYKLPWESDNSERQKTPGEKSISQSLLAPEYLQSREAPFQNPFPCNTAVDKFHQCRNPQATGPRGEL